MTMFISDLGIVLRKFNVGEKDQVVRILTKSKGKMVVMAKGVRSPMSRKCGAVDLGHEIAFSARESKSGMPYLEQVRLERSARGLVRDSSDVLFALLQFTDLVLADEQQVEGVYDLTVQALVDMGQHEEVLTIFQVKLLSMLGFVPALDRCLRCGNGFEAGQRLGADLDHGGFVCCLEVSALVDHRLVRLLSFFQREGWNDCLRVSVDSELREKALAQVKPFLRSFTW